MEDIYEIDMPQLHLALLTDGWCPGCLAELSVEEACEMSCPCGWTLPEGELLK